MVHWWDRGSAGKIGGSRRKGRNRQGGIIMGKVDNNEKNEKIKLITSHEIGESRDREREYYHKED